MTVAIRPSGKLVVKLSPFGDWTTSFRTQVSITGEMSRGARNWIVRFVIAPPQGLYRGKRHLSNSNTLIPHAANNLAAVAPAGPAPTTITSAS
jgi:hypothetical protein